MQDFIRAQWEKTGVWAWLFSPFSLLVCLLARLKRLAYQGGLLSQAHLDVPLIVVGNLSVGGSGKTPLVAYIALLLKNRGYRPGIISRGYKGTALNWPQIVTADSDPHQVGDEPVMLAAATACPVVAGPNRQVSARTLLAHMDCNVIVSDDGFQHLKLARDIDILVFDLSSGREIGNGWCLPSGPLREPPSARHSADIQVFHGAGPEQPAPHAFNMQLKPAQIYALHNRQVADLAQLRNTPLHAIAGIGRPARFYDSLKAMGLNIVEHAFADHHPYTARDIHFDDEYDLITTEKDAIKLATLQTNRTIWVLPVNANLDAGFTTDLLHMLSEASEKHA